jgi:hypothetical protein
VSELPPCGVYRTTKAIGNVQAGRFVYFHNHGDPGPGVYLPESWSHNRARWSKNGTTIPDGFDPKSLAPLPLEGFYRVTAEFHCCEKKCTKFEPETLVQLGYNGEAKALVFVPVFDNSGVSIPDRGTVVDEKQLRNLSPLKVVMRDGGPHVDISLPRGVIIH